MSTTSGQERRRAFRVDDEVHLEFRALQESDQEEAVDATLQTCRALMQLRELSAQSGHLLAAIRKNHGDIAQYLSLLDKKIEAVAQLAGNSSFGGEMQPNTRVNISAGGIAFATQQPFPVGQRLGMRIVLFPSLLCIQPQGKVVYARERPQARASHRYLIGVEFEPLPEQEQDMLIRHLLEKQSAQRRREKGLEGD